MSIYTLHSETHREIEREREKEGGDILVGLNLLQEKKHSRIQIELFERATRVGQIEQIAGMIDARCCLL